jgi:hypothetical protein
MRTGWFRAVHVESFDAHRTRALLDARLQLVGMVTRRRTVSVACSRLSACCWVPLAAAPSPNASRLSWPSVPHRVQFSGPKGSLVPSPPKRF